MMTALVEVGGIPDAEVVAALEGYAGMLGRSGPQSMMLALGGFGGGGSSVSDEVLMGQLLAASQTAPSEAAIERVISRAEELRATDAATATQLLEIVHRWPSAAGDRDIARRIADNTAQATNIRLALQHRDKFRENAADAVRDSVASSGFPAGIFAVFSGDRQRVESILKGTDIAAIRALFASARLAGEALPFDVVERVFNSGDANVERTAQAYLVSNDGPGARKVLNARYKGTVIFGDGESDDDSGSPADSVFGRQEQQLLTRMRGADAPDEVFALFGFTGSAWSNTTNTDQIVIERHGDKATLRSQGNRVGRSNRTLSAEEFGRLKTFIDSENVEDLGPISAMVSDITLLFEYVHLTKSSGRRVYMNNLGFGNTAGSVHDKLVAEFLRVVQPR
jgi:hypothetical protein